MINIIQELRASLERDQVVNYFYFTTATVLLYDHLLSIGTEIRYVWPAKWTLGKVLYILSRYPPYVDISFVLYHQLAKSPSVSLCHDAFWVAGWTNIFGITVTEIVLIMRTWALWGQNKWIPIGLGGLGVIALAGSCYALEIFLNTITFIFVGDLSPDLRGCFVSGGSKVVYIDFIILIVFETVVLVLTLYIGFRNYRENVYNSSLITSLFKDGILYYLYLFVFSLLNIIVPLTAPREALQFLIELQRVMHSVCASHILLHLRQGISRRKNVFGKASNDPSSVSTDVTLDTAQAGGTIEFANGDSHHSAQNDPDDDPQYIEDTWFGEEPEDPIGQHLLEQIPEAGKENGDIQITMRSNESEIV